MIFFAKITNLGDGAAVLIRAAEPLCGLEQMRELRKSAKKSKTVISLKDKDISNGPSKLCQALNITKTDFDQQDLCKCEHLYLTEDSYSLDDQGIIIKTRIGIDGYGKEFADKPLRFYVKDNCYVSIK